MATPAAELELRLLRAAPPVRVLIDPGDRLVGFVRVHAPADDDPEHTGHSHMIARAPTHRGRGLGPVLLGEAQSILAAHGARRFALEVVALNQAALELYRRHGFETIYTRANYRLSLI